MANVLYKREKKVTLAPMDFPDCPDGRLSPLEQSLMEIGRAKERDSPEILGSLLLPENPQLSQSLVLKLSTFVDVVDVS